MIAVPWFMFSVLLCLYTFVFHQIKSVVYGALVAFAVVSVVFCFLDQMSRPGRVTHWYRKLGVLSGMATILAMICGSYTYEHHMALYWTYEENQKYTNVLPTEPAAAHADAGKIIFSDTARVDSTRSVGFKAGTVYCVAPILDDTQQSKVEYWAAGTDCCQQRADFSCDDAWDPKAKSGVVLIEPGGIFPSNQYFFHKAVTEAEAAFDLASAQNPLFLRWVTNPDAVQDDYWRTGIGFLVASTCIYLLFSIIVGAVMQMTSRTSAPSAAAAQKTRVPVP